MGLWHTRDVYKRQDDTDLVFKAHAIGCDIIAKNNQTVEFLGSNAIQEAKHWSKKIAKKLATITTDTVSYTHLDVYKRQP